MLQKINQRVRFNNKIKRYIKYLKPLIGGEWDSKDILNKELKSHLKKQLTIYQNNKCAYCGLSLNETGKTEIEHVAPKGGSKRPKYPQYAYTTYNLVLSCNLCNSPIKKGMIDTVEKLDKLNYKNCTFNIIHPYFDDPADHVEFIARGNKIIIIPKTDKGQKSIDIFQLDNETHCSARAKQVYYEKAEDSLAMESLLTEIITYKRRGGGF